MDEMQYRSGVNVPLIKKEETSPQDQANYSTLRTIHRAFAEKLESLYADFNAFNILEGGTTQEKADNLVIQVKAKQEAYDTLVPLLQELEQALMKIDNQFKQK